MLIQGMSAPQYITYMGKTSLCVEAMSQSDYHLIQIHPASPKCMGSHEVKVFTVYPRSVAVKSTLVHQLLIMQIPVTLQ